MSCGSIRLKSLKVSVLSMMSKFETMIAHFDALSVSLISAGTKKCVAATATYFVVLLTAAFSAAAQAVVEQVLKSVEGVTPRMYRGLLHPKRAVCHESTGPELLLFLLLLLLLLLLLCSRSSGGGGGGGSGGGSCSS